MTFTPKEIRDAQWILFLDEDGDPFLPDITTFVNPRSAEEDFSRMLLIRIAHGRGRRLGQVCQLILELVNDEKFDLLFDVIEGAVPVEKILMLRLLKLAEPERFRQMIFKTHTPQFESMTREIRDLIVLTGKVVRR